MDMTNESEIRRGEDAKLSDALDEQNIIDSDSLLQPPISFGARVRKLFSQSPSAAAVRGRDSRQDRTRPLLLLLAGIVGAMLLFVGVFSTPPVPAGGRQRSPVRPNLGRREVAQTTRLTSATPLLNVQPQQDSYQEDRIDAKDITNTSRQDGSEGDRKQEVEATRGLGMRNLRRGEESIVYRLSTNPMKRNVDMPIPGTELLRTEASSIYSDGLSSTNFQTVLPVTGAVTPKSSIVFIRTSAAQNGEATPRSIDPSNVRRPSLLPPGTRLIGRLESAVTSALKAPVVAVVEYNYERDGMILIPAGTKAIGELQQSSTSGYVGIRFHTLQMPDGGTEQIDALAMDLKNEPLKGTVTGTNRGRKFLTGTLSGVGTIGAYVIGAGGSALGQPITGATLLRERLAGNIASAGEQELTNAAVSQNIVVTVPAQTRLYIVFQTAATQPAANSSTQSTVRTAGTELPTVQEFRELLDLKREINRMYEASASTNPAKP
jgi:type IV secretory pathway VirB10-like protein